MADRQKVEIKLIVSTPNMSPKKVAALIDRLIAVGIEEANDSMEDEHHEDAEVVLEFAVGKAKVIG
jgi:hypothetical protein